MSLNFRKKLRLFTLFVLLPLVVAKFLWSLSLFALDKGSIERQKAENYNYHYSARLAPKILGTDASKKTDAPIVEDEGEQIKNMKLKGTYLGGDASFMVIEEGGVSSFVYIGEMYKGYELIKVAERKVVLQKHGKNYYILLWDEENQQNKSQEKVPHQASGLPSESPEHTGMPTAIPRAELNSYVKDPSKIWKNIRIQEQRENGQISGFRVNYVKKSSFFDTAGLRSGDVIKGIDGNEITSLADVMKYYTNVESLDSLSLTINRAGEEIELDFNVN